MNNGTLTVLIGLVGLYFIMQQQRPAAPAPVPVATATPRTNTEPTPKEIAEDVIDILGDLYKIFDNA